MAQGNTTLAIDKETRDRLNAFVLEYNKHKDKNAKELTAKNFIGEALDYFQRTGVDFATDVVALPTNEPSQNESLILDKLETILRGVVDVNLKTTAIGQGVTTISANQTKQIAGTDEVIKLTTGKYYKLESEEKVMEYRNLTKLGEVLKAWRIKQNISAYKLSEETKINYRVLRNIESGKDVYLRSFLRYLNFIFLNDAKFDFQTYYKCWANIYDEELGLQTRNQVCEEIRELLTREEPKDKDEE